MSDPNSVNPLFPNPTVMPDAYQKDKLNPKFNKVLSQYGKNELGGQSGAPVTESYRKQQSDRKTADRYGMKKK